MESNPPPPVAEAEKFSLRKMRARLIDALNDFSLKLVLERTEAQMNLRYPDQITEFKAAADIYAKTGEEKTKKLAENNNPHIAENVHLIDRIAPLHLEEHHPQIQRPDSETARKLRAMEMLDYCHNPAKMAARTGLSELEITSISENSRRALAATYTELMAEAYGTLPLNQERVDSDTFSRPLAIFITDADLKVLRPDTDNIAGFAETNGKAAFVGVDPARHITTYQTPEGNTVRAANQYPLYDIAVHEFAHLLRLVGPVQKLHKRHLWVRDQKRHSADLEEGNTTLLTHQAMLRLYPQLDTLPNLDTKNYALAAARIRDGLVPMISGELVTGQADLGDLPIDQTGDIPAQLQKIVRARFMLGDYELLRRGTAHFHNERTLITAVSEDMRQYAQPWGDAEKLLNHPAVFGHEIDITNSFSAAPDAEGDRHNLDLERGAPIPLPTDYYHQSTWYTYRPDYTYEICEWGTKDWKTIPADKLTLQMEARLRINYVDVKSDTAHTES